MKRAWIFPLCLFFLLVTPLACQKDKVSTPAEEDSEVVRWIEGMKSGLPAAFCKDGTYFRECFKVTAQQCEAEAIRVTRICLEAKQDVLKAMLEKDGGRFWGEKVGECAGQAYEVSLKAKQISNPKCDDLTNWI